MPQRRINERPIDRASLGLTPLQYRRAMAVPWRRAILRFKPAGMKLGQVYKRMGWSPGILSSRSRVPDLRISLVGKLADVLCADRGRFAAAVIEELRKG